MLNDSEGSGLDTCQFHGMAWSLLAQVPNMEKQRYEKQHQAVDIPSLSGLPEMVTTVASAIVGRYNSMAACGHVLFF